MVNFLTILLLFLQLIVLVLILLKLHKNDLKDDSFVVSNSMLHEVVDLYSREILQDKVDSLKQQFDLNPRSKTQSIKPYTDARNILLSDAAKEIMKKYISKKCQRDLLKFYTIDGLILTIIAKLKLKG